MDLQKTYIIPLFASIVMGIGVFLSYELVHKIINSNAIATILSICVGVLIYFVLLLLMKGLTESELARMPKGNTIIALAKKMHLLQES